MKHRFFPALAIAVLATANLAHRTNAGEAGRLSTFQAPVFLPFDFYPRHREELGLNAEQVRVMERIAEDLRLAAQELETERGRRTKALQEVMAHNPIDAGKAMEAFQAVLDAENKLKALQFRSGITMRNALSTEQSGRLQPLAAKESASRGLDVRAQFSERLQQLRAEIQQRTSKEPAPEILERIRQIEQTAKAGRLGEAKDQLEQVLRLVRGQSVPDSPADTNRSGALKGARPRTDQQ